MYSCSCDTDNNNTDINNTDRNFASVAYVFNSTEADAGQLGTLRGNDAAILQFGQLLADHYQQEQPALSQILNKWGVHIDDSTDASYTTIRAQLMTLTGRAFDSVYVHQQSLACRRAIEVFTSEQNYGHNYQLKQYASTRLPVLQLHQKTADSLAMTFP